MRQLLATRTDLWRAALLTALGIASNACSGDEASSGCGESTLDPATGLATCANGVVHRPAPVSCENHLDLRPADAVYTSSIEIGETCTRDADCTEEPYGRCLQGGAPLILYSCRYGCLTDADCGEGQFCICTPEIGECRTTTCRTDADCGGNFKCAERTDVRACGNPPTYACQTASDTCAVDVDCASGQFCLLDAEGSRHCTDRGAVCGRPFLVREQVRTAALVASAEWLQHSPPDRALTALDLRLRVRLGEHWSRVALMEHASIAAFARFTLQLLALGAPPELVLDSQAAQRDEAEHARLAFGMASAYLGRPVGPGRLDLAGALDSVTLQEVVELVFMEGCVGETLAALEAAEAAARCLDGAVREMLARIADDERRHAELAWRFVAWALGSEPSLTQHVQSLVDRVNAEHEEQDAPMCDDLLAHGVLGATTSARVRTEGLRSLVVPCGRALVASVLAEAVRQSSRTDVGRHNPSRAACSS